MRGPLLSLALSKRGVVDYTAYRSMLFPVLSTWAGYWTTWDEAIGPNPGLAFTNVSGVDRVDTWTDQRSGLVIPGLATTQRPDLALDAGFFAGQKTVQCRIAGSKGMLGDLGTNIFAAGTRPYTIVVYRSTAVPTAEERIWEFSDNTALQINTRHFMNVTGNGLVVGLINNNTINGPAITQTVKVQELYNTAAGGGFLRLNGVAVNNAAITGNGVSAAVNRFTIGCHRSGAANFANINVAELHAFTVYPGDEIALRLVNAIMRKWAVA